MRSILAVIISMVVVTQAQAGYPHYYSKACCYPKCYVQKEVQYVQPEIENKVNVLTRLVGFSQPAASKYSLDEQFQKQYEDLAPLLQQGSPPPPLRRFAFQRNTPEHIARPLPQLQKASETVQYQTSTQVYQGLVEVPVVITNGKVVVGADAAYQYQQNVHQYDNHVQQIIKHH